MSVFDDISRTLFLLNLNSATDLQTFFLFSINFARVVCSVLLLWFVSAISFFILFDGGSFAMLTSLRVLQAKPERDEENTSQEFGRKDGNL